MRHSTDDRNARLRRPAGVHTVQLGDIRVSYVPDGVTRLKPQVALPDTTDAVWDAHPEYLDESGSLVASIGGLLVENGDRALLIDAGFGPRSWPPGAIHGGALVDSLNELGRRPEEIEAVAFTHLHPDHTGWAWLPAPGTDRPAFARADYLLSGPEWARRDLLGAQEAAVLSPRVRTVDDGQEIFPGVRMRITGGHSPGHAEYVITSGGQRLIAFGDALISPIQVEHPHWSSSFDHDPATLAAHRHRLIAQLAAPDTLGFGMHFADVVFGHIRQDGDHPTWHPWDADA
ncbi:MBL fold metallo-hydrolase [Yinghuangia seranimata]|uniref:MBL fold metallo-hydrolase n=1 Tax=Yinghuangia seranimata TaxID=408067 RepID=UPI00248B7609|nr:MBL fold metallo-hydrolase [Yinghuangia seranimata]MDI2131146.1 MBL fold metallo-hydrolase [Yinghuangia seranimata]